MTDWLSIWWVQAFWFGAGIVASVLMAYMFNDDWENWEERE